MTTKQLVESTCSWFREIYISGNIYEQIDLILAMTDIETEIRERKRREAVSKARNPKQRAKALGLKLVKPG